MMLTFAVLAPFEENAGSLVATVALKKTRASLTLLGMTSLGRKNSMVNEMPNKAILEEVLPQYWPALWWWPLCLWLQTKSFTC
jgi:hypothetical protein